MIRLKAQMLVMAGSLITGALVCGCQQSEPVYREALPLFGTLVDVQLYGADQPQAQQALASLKTDFRKMHRHWHAWKPGMLTELNEAIAKGREVAADPFLLPLLQHSIDLSRRSNGLFNPAIGKLVSLWGFHADALPGGPPPNRQSIRKLVQQNPGMNDLLIRDGHVRSRNRFVQLDFGGIGKGAAVDFALKRLRDQGFTSALVNAGGDLCASGRPGNRSWQVGIQNPDKQGLLASLELADDECVFTSGTYARFRLSDNKRYAHIIDPRTGWPVEHLVSVTVVHGNGIVADAAATALAIAGPRDWSDVARSMGVQHVLVVDNLDRIQVTPVLAKRVHFKQPVPSTIQIVPL